MDLEFKCDNWVSWIIVLGVIVFLLWILTGGTSRGFVGLDPLDPTSTSAIDKHTVCNVVRYLPKPTRVRSETEGRRKSSKPKKCSRGESECRRVLESGFGVEFPQCRPEFLRNPETSRKLELDCYNESLKLAVEYNGIQHYVYPNFTGQTYDKFLAQVRRDAFKIEACDRAGVYLITVPYRVKLDEIESYILDRIPGSLSGLIDY